MKNRVITISREFGSGGRTIGKNVAERLGLPCYDSALIHALAEESGFAEDYVKDAGEYAPGGFLSAALTNRAFGPTNGDLLWELQYRTIQGLAEKGPCGIRQTACGCLSMRIWRSAQNVSSRSTVSVKPRQNSA